MRKLMDDKTSFSIAHRLATIRDSNRIMVLNGGAIAEMASHDELMAAKGLYYALYMSQFKGKGPGGEPGAVASSSSAPDRRTRSFLGRLRRRAQRAMTTTAATYTKELSAAWASIGAATLPDRTRMSAKITPATVVIATVPMIAPPT